MISITFGMGAQGTSEFFPESDFSILMEEDSIVGILEDTSVLIELSEDNIAVILEEG